MTTHPCACGLTFPGHLPKCPTCGADPHPPITPAPDPPVHAPSREASPPTIEYSTPQFVRCMDPQAYLRRIGEGSFSAMVLKEFAPETFCADKRQKKA